MSIRRSCLLAVGVALVAAGSAQAQSPRTPSAVVEEFMRATADSNLTRMGDLFGTSKGPARATGVPKDYEKRMVIMNAYLKGVTARALNEVDNGKSNERVVTTEIAHGVCRVTIPITTVKTKAGWIVRSFDLTQAAEVRKPCEAESRPGNPGR